MPDQKRTTTKTLARNRKVDNKNKDAKDISPFEATLDRIPIVEPKYTEYEESYRGFLLRTMENDRNAREMLHDEFNSKSYLNRYVENFKAGNSYTPPRKNQEDTSVVTGTTREKKLAIINAVLQLVFDTKFRAFDSDNLEDQQLGEAMSDCVFQANQIEQWDEKKIYAYEELATQGDVFVEDLWIDEKRVDKKKIRIKDITEDTFRDFKPEKALKVVFSGPRRRVIPGPQVYLGNIREPNIRLQPHIFTRQIIPYEQAKAIYGHLPRFNNVPRQLRNTAGVTEDHWGFNWRLESIEANMVEVICYQDKYNDEYQILLNGVMQLPVGFPMPWEHGEYNIVQGHLEPISAFFAYSKSIPDKTFLDQQVLDEMYRLAVLKTQKSFMPPIANYSANILSKNMFLPGKVNNDLEKGDIEVLGGNPQMYAMTQSEFEMFKLVKGLVDEKSVNPSLQGKAFGSRTTAVEVDTVVKQAKQQLGVMIFGFMNLHMQLDLLRLYTLLENYTKPDGEKVDKINNRLAKKFAAVSVEREIGGRGFGIKRVEFTEEPKSPEELYDMEEGITRDPETKKPLQVRPPRKPVKIMQIKPSVLRSIQYRWYPQVVVNERETSLTDQITFEDGLVKANQMWGPQAINQDYAKQQWAAKRKIDPQYFFTQGTPAPAPGTEELAKIEESPITKMARSGPSGVQEAARQGAGGV